MASEHKSEQATPRRRQKVREEGRVARGRELAPAMALCACIAVLGWQFAAGVGEWKAMFRSVLMHSVRTPLTPTSALVATNQVAIWWLYPALAAALGAAFLATLLQGGVVVAPASLKPQLNRISPATRLGQIFSVSTLASLAKSILPTSVIVYIGVSSLSGDWVSICGSVQLQTRWLARWIGERTFDAAWKGGLVLACWGAVDYLVQKRKFEQDLRMTRQEVREEAKESEGNPQVKARIRKLQRQTRRKRMLSDVARAAVVITNPTHYAIALEYNERVIAPVVVAKGRNLLAQQIKQTARWHGVPMIENVPLAHALYRTADVGQTIPAKLYAAVAEVLAFVMRAQARVSQQGAH